MHALGLDHLEVGWHRNGGPIEVVPNEVLSPTMAGGGGWRTDPSSLPPLPGLPAIEADAGPHDVFVGWAAPAEADSQGPATFYEVTVTGGGETQRASTWRDTAAEFVGLRADTTYEMTVRRGTTRRR